MGEIKTSGRVVSFFIKYRCDQCNKGEMVYDNKCCPSYPAQYYHTCNKCGHRDMLLSIYPKKVTEDIDLMIG